MTNIEMIYSFKQRLLAVLDYDGIEQSKRVSHLSKACGVSVSTARRMLGGKYNLGTTRGTTMFDMANALNVHWRWIYDGLFEKFEPRTARIQLVMIKGETSSMADAILDSVSSPVPGEPDHLAVGEAIDLGLLLILEQHRRLTKWEKNKNLRFMIRLSNDDPKANRLLKLCSLGQISKQQLYCMV